MTVQAAPCRCTALVELAHLIGLHAAAVPDDRHHLGQRDPARPVVVDDDGRVLADALVRKSHPTSGYHGRLIL